jgi:hypothetical protein
VAVALAAAVAAPARADPVKGFGEVRLGLMHFDYAEHDPAGVVLDRENGWVPSLTGEAELHGEKLFGRAMLRLAKGTVAYDGHAQSTDPTVDGLPVQTDSDATFLQGEVQFGGWVDDAKHVALFGAVGARRWDRDILGTTIISRAGVPTPIGGLSEVYTWWELQAGLRWTFLEQAGTTWDADVRVVRTAGASIDVDLTPFVGTPTTASMDLASRTGWRLGSSFRRQLHPNGLFLVASAWAEGYAFGKSDVNPIFGIYEPDSKTTNFGLEVGLGGRF